MIITRTPFRVSFAGGGSDLPGYYAQRAYGAVLSAAVKHYMYVVIHPYFQDKIRIKYSQTEDVTRIDDIRHPIVRECLRKVQIRRGIEIASFADVPAGTGLGSSSAFTVGLLNALYAFKGELKSKHELAQEACEIEIDILKEPIGKQDQYAAAYGGLNYIRFNKDESVTIERILIDKDKKKQLESKLKLYYTGDTRSASKILKQQGKNLASNKALTSTDKLVSLADTLKAGLCQGKIDQIGKVLHQGWQLKQQLAEGITNTSLNKQYERFLNKGASGGKLLGAGGAGFFLVYADSHDQFDMRTNRTLPFAIDDEGSRILFMTHSLQTKPDEFFDRYRTTLVDVISKIDSSEFKTFTDVLDQARRRRAQIFIFGNGGSASAASHFVCDLNKGTWCDEAPPFKVISLSDNVPLVMAYANDVSYNDIFTLQMRNFMKKDDLAIGVSSSGNSENVNLALEYAATEGLETFGIIGNKGGRMGGIVQKSLIIPSLDTQHIEDAHIIVMHCCMQWFMFHANKTCQK